MTKEITRRTFIKGLGLLALDGLLAACRKPVQKEVTSTVVFNPTLEPSQTPTSTSTPTETMTATNTPTSTPTETMVPTNTATFTPEPTFTPKPEVPKEEVLQIEGLDLIWNSEKKRWEYVDPQDGLMAGYWNNQEKRFELTADRLRGEWQGLYVPGTLSETKAVFQKTWNHGQGEIKLPLPLEFKKGEIVEDKGFVPLLCFRNIPSGTVIYAPFDGRIVRGASVLVATGEKDAIIDLIWQEEDFCHTISFKSFEDYLGPKGGQVKAGTPLVRLSDKLQSPLLPGWRRYQLILGSTDANDEKAFGLSLANLQRDEKGRFVYLSP